MLTLVEKIIFILLLGISFDLSRKTFSRMFKIINKGTDSYSWSDAFKNFPKGLQVFLTQQTLFKTRPIVGFIHALVAWGFSLYMLVNLFDIIAGYANDFSFFEHNVIGFIYRLFVDIFSVLILLGVSYFLIRRFITGDNRLNINEPVFLSDAVRKGVKKDSLIVGLFILLHVGGRFVGATFEIANSQPDSAQPFATFVSGLWNGMSQSQLIIGEHISWWFALGLILAFVPYFPLSKHAHLFMGPLNFMAPDERNQKGKLKPINFEDESIEQYGAANFEHLSQKSILESYACIMCNRCQDNCPAYQTGKQLSPAAIEINKRYFFNENGNDFIAGKELPLSGFVLTDEALWACTTCNFCVEVCPVGNEPLTDILKIRQDKVMMESAFPKELNPAFNNLEVNGNPWGYNQLDRANWSEGLNIKTLAEDNGGEYLFWVGCAGSYDPRYQKVSKSFVKLMQNAEVDFRILGNEEKCNGDTARRAGNEYLAQMMMQENIDTLNNYGVKKIVTACPHCFNSIKNDYPEFGGKFEVLHHSQLLDKLVKEGKIKFQEKEKHEKITYHDSCYLGRYNKIYDEPRTISKIAGIEIVEMDRNKDSGFCCGAGGGRMFMEETEGTRINENRAAEAIQTGAETVASACPFCMTMMNDGVKANGKAEEVTVKDIAEIMFENLKTN